MKDILCSSNILIEFGIPMQLGGVIKMCLNETCITMKSSQVETYLMHFLLRMV